MFLPQPVVSPILTFRGGCANARWSAHQAHISAKRSLRASHCKVARRSARRRSSLIVARVSTRESCRSAFAFSNRCQRRNEVGRIKNDDLRAAIVASRAAVTETDLTRRLRATHINQRRREMGDEVRNCLFGIFGRACKSSERDLRGDVDLWADGTRLARRGRICKCTR